MRGALAVLTLAACLTPAAALAQEAPGEPTPAYADADGAPTHSENVDPWEGFNRTMFATHEAVDQAVLEPVARGYRAVTPEPVRNSVRSFLRNLRSPVILANDLLQGEFGRAGRTMVRFGLNSTVGFLGLFDPATGLGIEGHDEDFGQTLAVWGVDSGPYLFIPLFGPTTVRDGGGRIVDNAFDPFNYAQFENADTFRIARGAVTGISARESVLDAVDGIRRDSMDPYASIRTSYLLLRQSAVQNGRANVHDLPDFEDTYDLLEDEGNTGESNTGESAQHPDQNVDPAVEQGLEPDAPEPTSPAQPGGMP
ncbi:MAG TPA: VacJ family lipoprotein [Terricaulis sp.]|nr:VacJ family lipoprotein [Terricaulis sp.]HRP10642.1 VacJ family lipoprotein [Terricaulis sp.]